MEEPEDWIRSICCSSNCNHNFERLGKGIFLILVDMLNGFFRYEQTKKLGIFPEKLFVAGADTDCCVLKIAADLFENNIRPVVLTNYFDSNGGSESHLAGITCMKRLIGEKQLYAGKKHSAGDLWAL